jgi:hypothetical protein
VQFGKGGPEGWLLAASRAATERSARALKGHPGFLARRARKCPARITKTKLIGGSFIAAGLLVTARF